MRRIRGSGLIALALAGCQGGGPAPVYSAEDICAYRMSGGVCHVSPTQLLTAPEKLAGREVVVVLYYPGFGARVLFASRDAAQSNDLSSGFVVPGCVPCRWAGDAANAGSARLLPRARSLRTIQAGDCR